MNKLLAKILETLAENIWLSTFGDFEYEIKCKIDDLYIYFYNNKNNRLMEFIDLVDVENFKINSEEMIINYNKLLPDGKSEFTISLVENNK